jgi:hypothetical protein
MKRFSIRLLLIAVWLSACAPSAPVTLTARPTIGLMPNTVNPSATPVTPLPQPISISTQIVARSTTQAVPTDTPIDPRLHATDPTTVQLASGGPLLVEFFEFW